MATIEPRLMHLSTVLNTQQADSPSTVQLGPITTSANNNNNTSLFLPTLSRDAGQQQHQHQQQLQRVDKQLPTLPPIHTLSNESLTKQTPRIDPFGSESAARHPSSSHSLQLLLSNTPESSSTPLSLRRSATDHPDAFQDAANKKRQRVLAANDEHIQLPQPLKKQKSTQEVVLHQQQHLVTVPPILNGLHEPPPNPNTSRFPPILAGVVDHEPPRISSYMHDLSPPAHIPASTTTTPPAEWLITSPPPTDGDKASGGKAKRRAAKPRRKWSDEETNNLLLGVSRHGVGKWTTILEDPDYKFNDRTAGDLKDRFRTCCPEELRGGSSKRSPGADKSTSGESSTPTTTISRHKNGLSLDALLSNPEAGPSDRDRGDSDSAPAKQRKSRAHRKKMEDLVELGIRGPFKKSHRRERRPFTDIDDKEILAGLKKHGPAWTKIQRDPEYHLQSRQPTDLRDRVRNKYPAIYASIEKTNPRDKDQRGSAEAAASSSSSLLEPSANSSMSKTMEPTIARSIEHHVSRQSSREELPKWLPNTTCEPTGTLPGLASVFADMPDGPLASSHFGQPPEMDISRLLLNDGHDSSSASERLRYGQGGMGGGGPVHPGGQDGSSSGLAHRRGH
ncbi:hypothetical protein B0T20DRAFT_91478 [Sordaria brevicollis]|uniref:MYB transcription factor n=1 Tax=Sordaria brevicollis TaxID=83679 RepID=A0AAE0U317_SORBR|nr:hypothetical protein B0T20DRAFT_91478 [Sordaria brevicollis]